MGRKVEGRLLKQANFENQELRAVLNQNETLIGELRELLRDRNEELKEARIRITKLEQSGVRGSGWMVVKFKDANGLFDVAVVHCDGSYSFPVGDEAIDVFVEPLEG